jgi:hypothetical protein
MTNEEIHNIYLHMTGKAEGLAEATGSADFPVMFAKAILEFDRMQRPWVGLTEIEIGDIQTADLLSDNWDIFSCARAIEAKLKEKNT